MKLELTDIQLRIDRTEDANAKPRMLMKEWERMYQLDAGFTGDWRTAVQTDGREQVTTPDPYNVIQLAMRLIPSQPKIDIPPREEVDAALNTAGKVEQWLTAMYQRVNWQQGTNFVEDLKLLVFKRGLGYIEAKWIGDELPEPLKKKRFPILIRTLDPLEVGFHRGPTYVEFAYHRYEDEKINVRQRYPNLKQWEKPKLTRDNRVNTESDLVTVTDFWYRSPADGHIYNCIIVDDEFAKEPEKTDYPEIPIIEVRGEGDCYSILHAINGLWQYKCRLASNIGTGVLWATWPFFAIQNENGQPIDDIDVRPLASKTVPYGTKIDQIKPEMNLNVLNAMLTQVDQGIQQSTFPGVLYGDAGNMQAGYGVNILSQAASGRVNAVRESTELALMWLNELVLALVDSFDEGDGVELWGRNEGDGKLYKLCLYAKDISGYYENAVQLKLNLPSDDMALQTLGIRMVDSGLLSAQTFWDKYLKITVPADEKNRILAQQTEKHPDIMKKMSILHFMKQYPDAWWIYLKGTEFEQMARQMATDAALELGIPLPPGFEPAPPPMTPLMPQSPGGAPPALSGGPMGPPMPPPGVPPIQPPAMLTGPMGGGMPPEMQGQLGGAESMGLPPDLNPALFANITGQDMAPVDEMAALLPPGVM